MKKNITVYTWQILLALVVLFIFQNMESSSISFLFWEFHLPRALIIFIVFVIGVLVGRAGPRKFF